jgi:hypothetical protein
MDCAFASDIESEELEELPCFIGSLDLERFQLSLFDAIRTCLAHGHGLSAEAETHAHPEPGSVALGEPGVPATGGCGS